MPRKGFTLAELAQLTNSKLVGEASHPIYDVADLESATTQDVSFLSNPKYAQAMANSQAGVVYITPSVALIPDRNFLINEDPSRAFQKTVEAFYEGRLETSGFEGIHPTAVIHKTATIGAGVTIGPHAVIDKEVCIGSNSFISAGCYIGPYSTVGDNCIFHSNVTIRERCIIGNRVILQPGVVIGSCGFGYLTDKQGRHTKLNQVGTVKIEDDVEIGANTTIDRARFKTTIVGRGTKLDNLVQIAHGVKLGEDNLFAAQTGIAGSATTGRCVIAGGQVAIAGHLHVGDGVMIAGKSGIGSSLPPGGKYNGIPALPLQQYNRMTVNLRNINKHVEEIKNLKKELESLKAKLDSVK